MVSGIEPSRREGHPDPFPMGMHKSRNLVELFILCLLSLSCQSKHDIFPPVGITNHTLIKELVQQNKGKVVLVNVWATWCAPCREEMPALLSLRRQFRDKGFELILVSADEPEFIRTKVQPMLKEFGVDFLTYINHDSTDEAFIAGMNPDWNGALPTSFLYDREGRLAEMMIGGKSYEQFDTSIKKLLN